MGLREEGVDMTLLRLENFLKKQNVRFQSIWHSRAYSAQKTASFAHVSGRELAKTVMVKLDGKMAMVVLPASSFVNLSKLRESTGARDVRLAHEWEFKDWFPDCEVGAMPPFGNLYGMDVFVARKLADDESISFNAGNHNELIRMTYRDYERLTHPKIIKVTEN